MLSNPSKGHWVNWCFLQFQVRNKKKKDSRKSPNQYQMFKTANIKRYIHSEPLCIALLYQIAIESRAGSSSDGNKNMPDCCLVVRTVTVYEFRVYKQRWCECVCVEGGVEDCGYGETGGRAVWVGFERCEQQQQTEAHRRRRTRGATGYRLHTGLRSETRAGILICRVWVSLWNRIWGHERGPYLKVSLFTSISIDPSTLSSSFK